MKYLFIQCFCLINVYFKTFTFLSINDHKSSHFAVDEFIRQLLTSQKFDELADKIADKAVTRIIQFEQGSQGPEVRLKSILSAKNNTNIEETLDRLHDKPVIKPEESSGKKKKLQDDDKPQRNKIGKINMQAFMKKDASLKSENLSLKYKYLTQKARDNQVPKEKQHKQTHKSFMVLRNNDNKDKKSQNVSEEEKKISEPEEIENKNKDFIEDVETNQDNNNDESIAEQEKEGKAEHIVDQNIMTNLYYRADDYENYKNIQSEDEEPVDQHEHDASKIDDALTTMRLSKITTKKYVNKINEHAESPEIEQKEKTEIDEINEDDSKGIEDSYENKYNSKNKPVNRFRTEGNKTFVFQSSPDYNEYLEEYDQVHKDHPEQDFL